MKRKLTITVVAALMFLIAIPAQLSARQAGDFLGNVLNTDIRVFINGQQIVGYNIGGWTYVVAEDLRAFGVSVTWNPANRTLHLTRGSSTIAPPPVPANPAPLGSIAFPFVYSDIVTYMNNNRVNSYNIQGQTVVRLDDVAAAFGQSQWLSVERMLLVTTDGTAPQRPLGPPRSLRTAAPFFDRTPNNDRNVAFNPYNMMGGTRFNNTLAFARDGWNDGAGTSTAASFHNLNGDFRILSGHVGRVDGSYMSNVIFTFIGDGRTLQVIEVYAASLPRSIEINVQGVQHLKIEVELTSPGAWTNPNRAWYALAAYLQ